jgi:hypothetical protein
VALVGMAAVHAVACSLVACPYLVGGARPLLPICLVIAEILKWTHYPIKCQVSKSRVFVNWPVANSHLAIIPFFGS